MVGRLISLIGLYVSEKILLKVYTVKIWGLFFRYHSIVYPLLPNGMSNKRIEWQYETTTVL